MKEIMRIRLMSIVCLGAFLFSCKGNKQEADFVVNGFARAEQQLSAQLSELPEPTGYPRTCLLYTSDWYKIRVGNNISEN